MDAHVPDGSAADPDGFTGDEHASVLPEPFDPNSFGDEIAGIDTSDWDVDADLIWGTEELPVAEADVDLGNDDLPM